LRSFHYGETLANGLMLGNRAIPVAKVLSEDAFARSGLRAVARYPCGPAKSGRNRAVSDFWELIRAALMCQCIAQSPPAAHSVKEASHRPIWQREVFDTRWIKRLKSSAKKTRCNRCFLGWSRPRASDARNGFRSFPTPIPKTWWTADKLLRAGCEVFDALGRAQSGFLGHGAEHVFWACVPSRAFPACAGDRRGQSACLRTRTGDGMGLCGAV